MQNHRVWIVLFSLITTATLAVDCCWAKREAVVVTKDGRTLRGEVVSDTPERITLLIRENRFPIERKNLESIQYIKTIAEQYKEKKTALGETDVDGFYDLLKWLVFKQRQYDMAVGKLTSLEKRFPEHDGIRDLKAVAIARAKLAREKEENERTTRREPKQDDRPIEKARPDDGIQRLRLDEINLIKVFELDLEAKPRVVVPKDVIEEVLIRYSTDPSIPKGRDAQRDLHRASAVDQLRFLFDLSSSNPSVREYYAQVIVRGDPPAIRTFQSTIHKNYVINYCGTTKCHGGEEAGKFRLIRSRPKSDKTVYTNFYILHGTRTADGYMIDRESSDQSLLLQYGLNPTDAATPHPLVPGWKQKILNTRHRDYERLVQWIGSLWRPTPKYGINYPLPTDPPQEQPEPNATEGEAAPEVPTGT